MGRIRYHHHGGVDPRHPPQPLYRRIATNFHLTKAKTPTLLIEQCHLLRRGPAAEAGGVLAMSKFGLDAGADATRLQT